MLSMQRVLAKKNASPFLLLLLLLAVLGKQALNQQLRFTTAALI